MLPPALQILARSAGDLVPPVTWIEPPPELAAAGLAPGRALCLDAHTRDLLARSMPATPALAAATDGHHRHTVVFLPKSRARRRMLMDLGAACTAPGGRLWVVGEKKQGAASAGRDLAEFASGVHKKDAARHCMLFEGRVKAARPFRLDDYWARFEVDVAGERMTLCSLPGVFSHGRLDPGTELLLQHLPPALPGSVLDFGSGCGVISVFASRRGAGSVSALDIDEAADRSTQATMIANDARAVSVVAKPPEAAGQFDWLISNPPFHRGFRTTLDTTRQFIQSAPGYLRSGGQLWLVANQHLGYRDDLVRAFGACEAVAESPKFRVYRAVAP